ncbi:MAG: diaminopimelate epimerase [Rhodothermia bacterium]|nr:MAG: diaminopimelate epimerase [Rhodothermia bacterium]
MQSEPTRQLVLEFTKMTGAGNDFIVLDNRFYHFSENELSDLAIRLCTRRMSVGADGLLALEESPDESLNFRMVYFNADGSRGSMCGNGARCLGRFARIAGMEEDPLRFEADAGRYSVDVPQERGANVRLHLPPYENYRPSCTLAHAAVSGPKQVDYIWAGTDHIVVSVDDVVSYPVEEVGPVLRNDQEISRNGANVNFVQLLEPEGNETLRLRVRTFERGVEAETMACGTGAVASAVVTLLRARRSGSSVTVEMNGGVLRVSYSGELDNPSELTLEGPADVVYRGTIEI